MKPIAFGKYTLIRRLARGGMAELFLARFSGPAGVERLVVIKLVASRFASDSSLLEMFADEARIAATLDHPNIGHVLEVGEVDGQYYLAMEHIHGKDLRNTIAATAQQGHRGIPLDVLVVIGTKVCAALDCAHEATDLNGQPLHIIHRDVSPSNIMLTYRGNVKLVDFGVAKAENRLSLTRPGCIKGKIRYLSPEQLLDEPIDRRSDIFTLGVSLWEAGVGRHLFAGEKDFEVFEAISAGKVPMPSSQREEFPEQLESILMKALSRKPDERYQTAREMQLDLERYATQAGVALSDLRIAEFLRDCFAAEHEKWEEAKRQRTGLLDHLLAVLPDYDTDAIGQPLTRTDDQQTIPPDSRKQRRGSGSLAARETDHGDTDITRPPTGATTTTDTPSSPRQPISPAGTARSPDTSADSPKRTAFFSGFVPPLAAAKPGAPITPHRTGSRPGDTHRDAGATAARQASRRDPAPVGKGQPDRKPTPVKISPLRRVAITPDGNARTVDDEQMDPVASRICDAARPTAIGSISPESASSAGAPNFRIEHALATPGPARSWPPVAAAEGTIDPEPRATSTPQPAPESPAPAGQRRRRRPRTGDWAHQALLAEVPRPGTHPYFQEDRATIMQRSTFPDGRPRPRRYWLPLVGGLLLLVAAGALLFVHLNPGPSSEKTRQAGTTQSHEPLFQLTSDPSGATVFSDRTGRELGKTPLTLPLEAVRHRRVELHLQGYQISSVELDPNKPHTHTHLEPSR